MANPLGTAVSSESLDVFTFDAAKTAARQTPFLLSPVRETRERQLSIGDADITSAGETNWTNFERWVTCMCAVHFDLELGQSIEMIYPGHHRLSEEEMKQVGYLAFPDSNSGCMGDHQYNIRLPCSSERGKKQNKVLFGSVYFRQVPDKSNRRGYFQKSVVVLSHQAHVSLYEQMAAIIAPLFFKNEQVLEAACIDIGHWPAPTKGKAFQLPLLEKVLEVRLPSSELDAQLTRVPSQPSFGVSAAAPSSPLSSGANLFTLFQASLREMHILWELMLTCEPIVVFAPDPVLSSKAVMGLLSLVAPLNHAGDYRPYFTIHDKDSQAFSKKRNPPPQILLGVTNPVFHKALEHWPHRVHIGGTESRPGGKASSTPSSPTAFRKSTLAFVSDYKACVEPDKAFLKAVKASQRRSSEFFPDELHDYAIRKNFMELTHTFMIPFERYVARLMPLRKEISPFKPVPKLKSFNPKDFVKSLGTSLNNLNRVRKGHWVTLYGRFLKSPNFKQWWQLRRRDSNRQLLSLYLDTVLEADLEKWASSHTEIEKVDVLVCIKDAVQTALKCSLLKRTKLKRLRQSTEVIIEALPEDLQASLRHPDLPPLPEDELLTKSEQ